MDMFIAEIRHTGEPSATGYNEGCRCIGCGIANTRKVSAARKRKRYGSAQSVVSDGLLVAREDIAGILEALTWNPDEMVHITPGPAGELKHLRRLINAHNRSGSLPRLQYATYDDGFWVSLAGDTELATPGPGPVPVSAAAGPVTVSAPVSVAVPAPGPGPVQLPRNVPLAMPRNVPVGSSPSVPAAPGRQASEPYSL